MDRSRKRPEPADDLRADKRPCSSSSEPSDSSPPPSHQPAPPQPAAMEEDRSDRSDQGEDSPSPYNSCDSDEEDPDGGGQGVPARGERFQRVLSGLGDACDAGAQLAGLSQLCEVLSLCMEDTLRSFPMDTALPLLVRLAGHESNPEMMLLAVRAITYLCDVMPRSADAVVRHGAVPVLCQRLLAIEYLDVAEQCLQALEKISRRQPVPCLQAGTITAVLSYVDFFSTTVQRVALSTVANVCKKLPVDCAPLVMESVPTLCNLLQYEDRKLVETVATCLIRITECFSHSSELLDELCKHGVIERSLHLIAIDGRTALSKATYTGLIGLLTKLATRSLVAVRTLFELNVSSSVKEIMAASSLSHGTSYTALEDFQSNQLVHEVLKLLNQLIPPPTRDDEDIQLVLAKERIIVDQPEFLQQFSVDILPVSIQVVNSGANLYVCYGCVSVINNIVYFSTSDMLQNLIKSTNISSFLAGLLSRKDHHVLILALKIIECLMQKLPDVCSNSFIKEGVIYAIDTLLARERCPSPENQQTTHSQASDNQLLARRISRCLCYAFDSSLSSSSGIKPCTVEKAAVLTLARHIKTTYFLDESMDSDMGLTEILQKLKIYCAVLNENVDKSSTNDFCAESEEYLSHILDQVMMEVNGEEAMSTFEFIESGIVKSLAHYLSNGRYLQGSPNCNISNNFLSVLKRFQKFACISLSNKGQHWEEMLLALLVRKLQNALSSSDNFPIIMSHILKPRNTFADIPVRHTSMHPCFKVRFVRDEREMDLCDYNDVLTVELSLSLNAIESYLWSKVRKNNDEHRAESAAKDLFRIVDTASGSKSAEVTDSSEDMNARTMHEASLSGSSTDLGNKKVQPLPIDTSIKPRELTSEMDSSLSSNDDGQVEDKLRFAPSSNDGGPRLIFSFEGKQLDCSATLYQAILEDKIIEEPDILIGHKLWHDVHNVTYKRAGEANTNSSQMACDILQSSLIPDIAGFAWQKLSFFSSMLLAELPCTLDKSNPSYDILFMLKVLEGLNRFSFHLLSYEKSIAFAKGRIHDFDDLNVAVLSVPQSEFVNTKITDKLEQQLRDPLASTTGTMPSWCSQLMAACPFLFSFEAKRKYFHLIAFGSSKFQHNQVSQSDNSEPGSVNDRRLQQRTLTRKKVKVNRNNILESATKMMASHARSKSVIEVEYNEEVGTGLGPTMEFYTLVSHEFQKVGFGMWREDHTPSINLVTDKGVGDYGFVVAPSGLFPRPWSMSCGVSNGVQFSDVIKRFVLLGQLVAKAIKDGRLLDVPFSRAFYRLILEQEIGIYDIQSFDPELGKTLLEFQALANKKLYLESVSTENLRDASKLNFRSMGVEDLCLDFTLPGYSDYVLSSASDTKLVNITNLQEYVSLVVDATIGSGISRQVEAFKSGFNEVFPLKNLHIFSEDELERLLCGERDTWDFNELSDHIKFDHGYTASSPPVISLLEIIQEFNCDQRRAFLQFVTGAPRLPPGGLAALSPKLTIVRKHCNNDTDTDLPSVMTCANYLKLPPYSSKERMRQRLLFAITEGQGSFHLS